MSNAAKERVEAGCATPYSVPGVHWVGRKGAGPLNVLLRLHPSERYSITIWKTYLFIQGAEDVLVLLPNICHKRRNRCRKVFGLFFEVLFGVVGTIVLFILFTLKGGLHRFIYGSPWNHRNHY